MAETSQDDSQHIEQDSNLISPELSPDLDDVSEDTATTSKRLQKLRTWWSKKRPSTCIPFPNLSDSDDSDDDFEDDADDVIFALARCRAMRVVGKLRNIQQKVETIYRVRYGPIDLVDTTCVTNLRGQQGSEFLDDIRWGQVMLLNSVDILQSTISMVRRLFLAYKMNMSKYKSELNRQEDTNHEDRDPTHRKRDEVVLESKFASRRHKIVQLITSPHHHDIIQKLCALVLYLFKPGRWVSGPISMFKPSLYARVESDVKTESSVLEDAFGRTRVWGLQDCLNDDSWNVLDGCHLPSSSIVSRCMDLTKFCKVLLQNETVTSQCEETHVTPSSMISQYQDIIVYFRNIALFCTYIFRRLKILDQELCVACKHLSEMRDKRFKNCKPVSDGDELLRRVMMKSEAVLEMQEIANTSTSPEECRAKRFMIKGILRIEKRAENLMYRFANWQRSREIPSRRINTRSDGIRKTKPEPMESRVFYKMTFEGLIIKRFCIAKDSLVRKAFSRSTTVGLNDVLLISDKSNLNSPPKQKQNHSIHFN